MKWANQLYDRAPEPKHLMILPAGPAGVAFSDFAGNDFMVGVLEFLGLA